jgi:hypothetical protein
MGFHAQICRHARQNHLAYISFSELKNQVV